MKNLFGFQILLVALFVATGCKPRREDSALAGNEHRPAIGISFFDQIIAMAPDGKVPYPFAELVKYFSSVAPNAYPAKLLFPIGRSLQKNLAEPN